MDLKKKLRFPGLGSYRGRFAYSAILITLLLGITAYWGDKHVDQVTTTQIHKGAIRAEASSLISNVKQQINKLTRQLQRQIIFFGEYSNGPHEQLRLLDTNLDRLINSEWVSQDRNLSRSVAILQQDSAELRGIVGRLQQTLKDVNSRLPSTRTMQEQLQPRSEKIRSLLDDLRLELSEQNLIAEEQLAILPYINRLSETWMNITLELRLLVSNRFGIFSNEPRTGMDARATNIALYMDSVPTYLGTLKQFAEDGKLGLLGPTTINDLQENIQGWLFSYEELKLQLESPGWRTDIKILESSVNPVADRLHQRLIDIQRTLDTQAASEIFDLAKVAEQLSISIKVIVAAVILLILTTYLFFNRAILQPIADTARALNEEAKGISSTSRSNNTAPDETIPPPQELIETKLEETKDLVSAFKAMRQQVYARQQRLDFMAHHDGLTHLPNRVLFHDRLEHALQLAKRKEQAVALMFLDLDNFKQVNDSLGHPTGDALLLAVADRLQKLMRDSDTVSRLGGDEFAILLEDINDKDDLVALSQKILTSFRQPINIEGQELFISTSIGIAMTKSGNTSTDDLLRYADTAMYEAKRSGRANFRFFTPELSRLTSRKLQLENQLRNGTTSGQFFFHYQPVTRITDNCLYYCEALLRWLPTGKALQTPVTFLQILEETGLIRDIMPSLLNQVGQVQAEIEAIHGHPLPISINLSPVVMQDKDFRDYFIAALKSSKIKPENFIIEVTEVALSQNITIAIQFINMAKEAGVKIVLDDFGSGQSSLNLLHQIPFDMVKINQDIMRNIANTPTNSNLIKAITKLVQSFDMEVVAEGIETEDQLQLAQETGCNLSQGFFIGRPMPHQELIARYGPSTRC